MGNSTCRRRAGLLPRGAGKMGQGRLESAAALGNDRVARIVERAIAETLAMLNPAAWRAIAERFVAAGLPPKMARTPRAHAWPERLTLRADPSSQSTTAIRMLSDWLGYESDDA